MATRNLLLVDGLASDAHEAEAVQDGNLEATHLGEGGINMERAVGNSVSIHCLAAPQHQNTYL